MPYVAKHKFARISPKKARLVANLVRGLPVPDALNTLKFTHRRACPMIAKVIESAVANAGFEVDAEELKVTRCAIDDGPRLKRWRPIMRGMANPILKRMCHITVELDRIEER